MRTIYAGREPPSGLSEEVLRRFLRDEYGIDDFPAAMDIIRRRREHLWKEGGREMPTNKVRTIQPYEHHCEKCVWAGWFSPWGDKPPYNVWLCDGKTIIIRYSSRAGDYACIPVGRIPKGPLEIHGEGGGDPAAMHAKAEMFDDLVAALRRCVTRMESEYPKEQWGDEGILAANELLERAKEV